VPFLLIAPGDFLLWHIILIEKNFSKNNGDQYLMKMVKETKKIKD